MKTVAALAMKHFPMLVGTAINRERHAVPEILDAFSHQYGGAKVTPRAEVAIRRNGRKLIHLSRIAGRLPSLQQCLAKTLVVSRRVRHGNREEGSTDKHHSIGNTKALFLLQEITIGRHAHEVLVPQATPVRPVPEDGDLQISFFQDAPRPATQLPRGVPARRQNANSDRQYTDISRSYFPAANRSSELLEFRSITCHL
ncbi:MAG: hypothetical protein HQ567_00715 [Candidatus Nealsonbacteria bacterium]|nr:hypothetical protein [Candidatus Nealsonbacteria bacterium]